MPHCKTYAAITDIPACVWDGLLATDNPFVSHAFLSALETSGCVGTASGWRPRHMLLTKGDETLAAMPLYCKHNSHGEFVFDWGWADAFARHGLEYYPKLVTAVPFSPVAGPRAGIASGQDDAAIYTTLFNAVRKMAEAEYFSSWHLLFGDEGQQRTLAGKFDERLFLRREAVQFHWFNHAYRSFDDFLATFRSARRKNIKRERRKVAEQGIVLERKTGADISDDDWSGFYQCYRDTYRKRSGHDGYLNRVFFEELRAGMSDSLLMVIARDGQEMLASSLFLYDNHRLYGRYWWALQDVSCLHFETCFYQGIEFCIERGLSDFDPGTQGEHKLLRGFEPIKSVSFHWIADQRFAAAIADFLGREIRLTDDYQRQAVAYLPYKKRGGNSGQ